MAKETFSSCGYDGPEFGSALALLGSISMQLSPTRKAGQVLVVLLLERNKQTATKQ